MLCGPSVMLHEALVMLCDRGVELCKGLVMLCDRGVELCKGLVMLCDRGVVLCETKHIALARELRDRFLEQVNGDPSLLLPHAKYVVARQLTEASESVIEVKALPAAA